MRENIIYELNWIFVQTPQNGILRIVLSEVPFTYITYDGKVFSKIVEVQWVYSEFGDESNLIERAPIRH
jgi:hypothetical protein